MTPAGLYAIAALRIAIGLAFVLAAPASQAPRTVRVVGLIVIIAGLTMPWFGVAWARAVANCRNPSGGAGRDGAASAEADLTMIEL